MTFGASGVSTAPCRDFNCGISGKTIVDRDSGYCSYHHANPPAEIVRPTSPGLRTRGQHELMLAQRWQGAAEMASSRGHEQIAKRHAARAAAGYARAAAMVMA